MKKAKVATRAKSPRKLEPPVSQAISKILTAQEEHALTQRKRRRQNADAQNKLEVPEFVDQAKEAAKSLHRQFVNDERLMENAVTLVSQKPLTKVDRKLYRAPGNPMDPSRVFTKCKAWNLGRTGDIDTTFVYLDEDGDIHVIAYKTYGDGKGGLKPYVDETTLSAHIVSKSLTYSTLIDILRLIELNSKAFTSP